MPFSRLGCHLVRRSLQYNLLRTSHNTRCAATTNNYNNNSLNTHAYDATVTGKSQLNVGCSCTTRPTHLPVPQKSYLTLRTVRQKANLTSTGQRVPNIAKYPYRLPANNSNNNKNMLLSSCSTKLVASSAALVTRHSLSVAPQSPLVNSGARVLSPFGLQFLTIKRLNCNMPIKSIYARQIFDSRGNPTVEVDLCTDLGLFRAAVPSGASTGVHEALELRDNDKANYHGKSVCQAVNHVNNTLGPEVVKANLEVTDQEAIDNFMIKLDGTENKSKFGANAILGISLAVCKAGAAKKGIPLYKHIADLACNKNIILPVPAFNVINGGSHAGNKLAMQEFMILPTGASSFTEAMKMGSEVYHHLKKVIKDKFGLDATAVGDEGGFAPNIQSNKEALNLIQDAIAKGGYTGKIEIGMDVAASEFHKDGAYDLDFKNPKSDKSQFLSPEKLTNLYQEFIKDFPIVSIEDPFDQDHWDAWSNMTANTQIQIVGDDLTVTNPKRIQTAVEKKACNCLLLKVNQIGTVTESIKAHQLAKSNGWGTMVSHRSGETEDTFIADLVVGLSTGQIKTGAPCRSERLAKYNQILRIEEELGGDAKFAGKTFRKPQ